MASMPFQSSPTGFYKTPVTKGLLGCMFLTSCALAVPLLDHLKRSCSWTYWDIFGKHEVWRLITSKMVFLERKDLICGPMLIYYFRIFERRYGSHKYASCLLATTLVTTVLELLICFVLHRFEIDDQLSFQCGPYSLIFPLFVSYFFDIPRITQTTVLGIPITGKALTYLLGFQMLSCSKSSALSGLCGILSGLLYRYNFLKIQTLLTVPRPVARLSNFLLNWLVRSSPPQESVVPMGATLEIQRQQQLEVLEQQMLLNHVRDMSGTPREPHFLPDFIASGRLFGNTNNNDYLYQEAQSGLRHRSGGMSSRSSSELNQDVIDPGPSVKEEQVQQLVEMGFERQNVLDALRTSNYDVNVATNMLLQDS